MEAQQVSKVVLVIGSANDKVIQFFAAKLDQSTRQLFCLVDQDLFATHIHVNKQHWRLASGRKIQHQQVLGVWNRMVNMDSDSASTRHGIEQFACYLMDEVYTNVLNRPKWGMSNHAKQYQIDCIQADRLKKINSYVRANGQLGWAMRKQSVIRKSMSGIRSIVTEVAELEKQKMVKEPQLFQPYIQGVNIRVHIINDVVIACRCDSDAVDYRYAAQVHIKRIALPVWVSQECIAICRQLKLGFAGIDLIAKGADYYLLEVNPAPGYAYFDVDNSVSHALIAFYQQCCGASRCNEG